MSIPLSQIPKSARQMNLLGRLRIPLFVPSYSLVTLGLGTWSFSPGSMWPFIAQGMHETPAGTPRALTRMTAPATVLSPFGFDARDFNAGLAPADSANGVAGWWGDILAYMINDSTGGKTWVGSAGFPAVGSGLKHLTAMPMQGSIPISTTFSQFMVSARPQGTLNPTTNAAMMDSNIPSFISNLQDFADGFTSGLGMGLNGKVFPSAAPIPGFLPIAKDSDFVNGFTFDSMTTNLTPQLAAVALTGDARIKTWGFLYRRPIALLPRLYDLTLYQAYDVTFDDAALNAAWGAGPTTTQFFPTSIGILAHIGNSLRGYNPFHILLDPYRWGYWELQPYAASAAAASVFNNSYDMVIDPNGVVYSKGSDFNTVLNSFGINLPFTLLNFPTPAFGGFGVPCWNPCDIFPYLGA